MTTEESATFNKGLEAAKEYADAIVKPSLNQLGGILSDTIGYWRLKNQVNLVLKAKKFLEEQGVESSRILPDIFVPLLEEGGNTEDETLSDMFAHLLASHLNPARQKVVHPSFSKTMGQLSSLDAKILCMVDRKDEYNWKRKFDKGQPIEDEGQAMWSEFGLENESRKRFNVTADEANLSVTNLNRLGLCEIVILPDPDFAGMPERDVCVSTYGGRFIAASTRLGASWRHRFEGKREELGRRIQKAPPIVP